MSPGAEEFYAIFDYSIYHSVLPSLSVRESLSKDSPAASELLSASGPYKYGSTLHRRQKSYCDSQMEMTNNEDSERCWLDSNRHSHSHCGRTPLSCTLLQPFHVHIQLVRTYLLLYLHSPHDVTFMPCPLRKSIVILIPPCFFDAFLQS